MEEKVGIYFVSSCEGFSHELSPMPCNISEQSGKTDGNTEGWREADLYAAETQP